MTDATKSASAAPGDSNHARPRGMCVRAADVSAVREDAREIDFICSTEVVDSYGEVVKQNWNLTRFSGNPVALWSHQAHELPIGYWRNVRVEDGALRGTLCVVTAEANPKAEHVWQSFIQRSLRAVSVGFMPHKVTYEEIEGKEGQYTILDENELYEISPTPLPANPEALIDMKARAVQAYHASRGAVTYEAHPPADTGKWDAASAIKRLRAWASDGKGPDHIDWNKYRMAFAWVDPKRTHEFGGFKLPHHDVKDGKLITPRAGVIAAGDALGRAKIPEADMKSVKSHLAQHYHQFDMKAPWEEQKIAPALVVRGVDTLNTGDGPRARQKESSVGKTKDGDMDESAKTSKAMVTCPECGAEFDPEDEGDDKSSDRAKHAQAFRARVATLAVQRSAPVIAERDALKNHNADLAAKHTLATTERDAARKEVDALSLRLVESDLLPLSGVKYAPAAHQGQVDLAKHYLSQGADGAAKWKAHLDGIKGGPDLKILGASVVPSDPTPSGLRTNSTDDAVALINADAKV